MALARHHTLLNAGNITVLDDKIMLRTFSLASLISWFLLSAPALALQRVDCGNGRLVCIPMFGLSQVNSPERKAVDQIYQMLFDSADNDRARLFNDSLATAYHQVLKKADDPNIQFWLIVINPTDQKLTGRFSIAKSTHGIDFYPSSLGLYLNCDLDSSLCAPGTSSTTAFRDVWNDIHTHVDEIDREYQEEFEPNSVKALGYHVAVPGDADPEASFSIAILGGAAAGRIKPDRRDVLRIGVLDGTGKTSDFGEVKHLDGNCALFATFSQLIDERPAADDDNPFMRPPPGKYCKQWIVETNSFCDGSQAYFHDVQDRDGTRSIKKGFIDAGEVIKTCGADDFFKDQ